MSISLLTGIVTFLTGAVYTFASFMLEDASIGRPHEPKIFPASLGILLVALGMMLIIQQIINERNKASEGKKEKVRFTVDEYIKKIAVTVVNSLVYAFLFARAGYVISTVLFLGAELLLFSGFKRLRMCLIVSVTFSLFIYILFSKLLGVYLPVTPFIWI